MMIRKKGNCIIHDFNDSFCFYKQGIEGFKNAKRGTNYAGKVAAESLAQVSSNFLIQKFILEYCYSDLYFKMSFCIYIILCNIYFYIIFFGFLASVKSWCKSYPIEVKRNGPWKTSRLFILLV